MSTMSTRSIIARSPQGGGPRPYRAMPNGVSATSISPTPTAMNSASPGHCTLQVEDASEDRSYAVFKACAMSAIRSDECSMPTDKRIVESRTPIFLRISAETPEWVMLEGRLASDSVPPRLTASLKICSAFKNLNAADWPPTMSNEKVEPAPVHCLANKRPATESLSW